MTVKHDVGSAKRSPEHLQDAAPSPKRAKTEEAATTSEVATQTTDPEPSPAPAPAMTSSATQTEPVAIIPVQHLSVSAVFINADIEAYDPPSPPPSPPVLPILPPAPTEPDWLVLYEMELEAIRMAKPFVTGKGAIVVRTNLRRKPVAAKRPQTNRVVRTTNKSAPTSRKSSNTAPAPARKTSAPASFHDVISVDSDDDKPTAKRHIPVGGAGEYSDNDNRSYQVSREGSYDSLLDPAPHDDHHELQQLIEQGLEECPEEEPKFYGVSDRRAATSTRSLLRFQDRFSHIGRYPSPEFGHRLIFGSFLYESKNKIPGNVEQAIEQSLNDATGEKVTMNEDKSIAKEWCPTRKTMNEDAISKGLGPSSEPDSYYLMKGFPLVEKVEFLVNKNSASPSGDCYWRTISFCLYGSPDHWDRVKADHIHYVHHVLSHKHHDRHDLYMELNERFFTTSSSNSKGQSLLGFTANMYQSLHMAHTWTPALIQQVTADLYNVCLIVFTRDRYTNYISETAVRGSHNARHIFMQFVDGNHFQPMVPNEFKPSEFRYPRVTVDKTAKYGNAPKATSTKTTLEHPWRNDFTRVVPGPVPYFVDFDREKARNLMRSRPSHLPK
ncbi:hypothetical protein LQW54_009607 [Pestalotiopsis sp. IQ-011]